LKSSNIFLLATMILTIVSIDILFFRNHLLARFLANVGVVLIFIAFYIRYLKLNYQGKFKTDSPSEYFFSGLEFKILTIP
jgi:hypothetical protein